jgi:hypothetical protein
MEPCARRVVKARPRARGLKPNLSSPLAKISRPPTLQRNRKNLRAKIGNITEQTLTKS